MAHLSSFSMAWNENFCLPLCQRHRREGQINLNANNREKCILGTNRALLLTSRFYYHSFVQKNHKIREYMFYLGNAFTISTDLEGLASASPFLSPFSKDQQLGEQCPNLRCSRLPRKRICLGYKCKENFSYTGWPHLPQTCPAEIHIMFSSHTLPSPSWTGLMQK